MVSLLYIISAATLVLNAVAEPAPLDAIHDLLARQAAPSFDPSTFAEKCGKDCKPFSSANCVGADCYCKDSTISNLAKCLGCGVRIEGSGLTVQNAQDVVDVMVDYCKGQGSPVKGATVSTKDNGVARNGALSAGAVAVAAFGTILVTV